MTTLKKYMFVPLFIALLIAEQMRATPLIEYMKVGLGAATLVACVWTAAKLAGIIEDIRDLAELYYLEGQDDRLTVRMVNEEYAALVYLQTVQNRINTARMLQNESPEFLVAAGLSDEELAWAANTQAVFINNDQYYCWDDCDDDDDCDECDDYDDEYDYRTAACCGGCNNIVEVTE